MQQPEQVEGRPRANTAAPRVGSLSPAQIDNERVPMPALVPRTTLVATVPPGPALSTLSNGRVGNETPETLKTQHFEIKGDRTPVAGHLEKALATPNLQFVNETEKEQSIVQRQAALLHNAVIIATPTGPPTILQANMSDKKKLKQKKEMKRSLKQKPKADQAKIETNVHAAAPGTAYNEEDCTSEIHSPPATPKMTTATPVCGSKRPRSCDDHDGQSDAKAVDAHISPSSSRKRDRTASIHEIPQLQRIYHKLSN